MAAWSEIIVRSISDTVALLEGNGHAGPFACFLSPDVFEAVHTPSPAMVLPRDRILPFLGGDYLCRSNTIPNGYGIVVAGVPAYETDAYGKRQKQSGGGPVEIVVATDISLRYLQQTPEPKFLFRIWEKIALRVKEWDAVAVLRPLGPHDGDVAMTTPDRPIPPTIKGVKAQIDQAIRDTTDKINDVKRKIEAHHAETLAKHKQSTVEIEKIEKGKADPTKVQELMNAHGRYLAGRAPDLENLESDLKALKKDRESLESQLGLSSLAD